MTNPSPFRALSCALFSRALRSLALAAPLTLATLPAAARADLTLFGADTESDAFFTIDVATGVPTFIAYTPGRAAVGGLAFHPVTGVLYGVDGSSFFILDPVTGASTYIGSTYPRTAMSDIAFDPDSGVLYGTDSSDDSLVTVNLDTGATTYIGRTLPCGSLHGLAFGGPATEPACRTDFNDDGVVNSTDVSFFVNQWFVDQEKGTLGADFNSDGVTNSTDVSDFISVWFEETSLGCG